MIEPAHAISVAAFYRFTAFPDCAALVEPLARVCTANAVKGTLLLAPEGINGTIAGPPAGIDNVLAAIDRLPGCTGFKVKRSTAAAMPFYRMKVRMKREIVTLGEPAAGPLATGHYVRAEHWNAMLRDPGTTVIDTRNAYEVAVGSFAGAIDPATRSFRDFPAWFRQHRETLLAGNTPPRVAMFCTGGIRCEKATAFLKSEGIADVHHLEGGILEYLETVAPEDSLWQGECFVFDERVSVGHGLASGSHVLCRACRMPVSAAARASPLYVEGIACPGCHADRNAAQRAGYAERHRQARLAEARGEAHIGAVGRKVRAG